MHQSKWTAFLFAVVCSVASARGFGTREGAMQRLEDGVVEGVQVVNEAKSATFRPRQIVGPNMYPVYESELLPKTKVTSAGFEYVDIKPFPKDWVGHRSKKYLDFVKSLNAPITQPAVEPSLSSSEKACKDTVMSMKVSSKAFGGMNQNLARFKFESKLDVSWTVVAGKIYSQTVSSMKSMTTNLGFKNFFIVALDEEAVVRSCQQQVNVVLFKAESDPNKQMEEAKFNMAAWLANQKKVGFTFFTADTWFRSSPFPLFDESLAELQVSALQDAAICPQDDLQCATSHIMHVRGNTKPATKMALQQMAREYKTQSTGWFANALKNVDVHLLDRNIFACGRTPQMFTVTVAIMPMVGYAVINAPNDRWSEKDEPEPISPTFEYAKLYVAKELFFYYGGSGYYSDPKAKYLKLTSVIGGDSEHCYGLNHMRSFRATMTLLVAMALLTDRILILPRMIGKEGMIMYPIEFMDISGIGDNQTDVFAGSVQWREPSFLDNPKTIISSKASLYVDRDKIVVESTAGKVDQYNFKEYIKEGARPWKVAEAEIMFRFLTNEESYAEVADAQLLSVDLYFQRQYEMNCGTSDSMVQWAMEFIKHFYWCDAQYPPRSSKYRNLIHLFPSLFCAKETLFTELRKPGR